MTILPEDLKSACQKLKDGATIGMVKRDLVNQGLGSGPSEEVLKRARNMINRRARLKHLAIAALGVVVLLIGGYWFYICDLNQNHRVKTPTLLIGIGLITTVYGAYFSTQNEI